MHISMALTQFTITFQVRCRNENLGYNLGIKSTAFLMQHYFLFLFLFSRKSHSCPQDAEFIFHTFFRQTAVERYGNVPVPAS